MTKFASIVVRCARTRRILTVEPVEFDDGSVRRAIQDLRNCYGAEGVIDTSQVVLARAAMQPRSAVHACNTTDQLRGRNGPTGAPPRYGVHSQ